MTVDLLAIMAHPDDAELLCAGALLAAADAGHRTGILDLTAGEAGSFGTAGGRQAEAASSAQVLGLTRRENAGLPDGRLAATIEARAAVATWIRELRPSTVILHWPEARHPDHGAGSMLGRDGCFVAGLRNADLPGAPHRPAKLLYALSFQEATPPPTFVVDITDQMERKLEAIFAFGSQFGGKTSMGDLFGGGTRPLREQILAHHAHYGALIRRPYGEPYWTRETMLVEDVVGLSVNSL